MAGRRAWVGRVMRAVVGLGARVKRDDGEAVIAGSVCDAEAIVALFLSSDMIFLIGRVLGYGRLSEECEVFEK